MSTKPPTRRPRHPMPDYIKKALEERDVWQAYQERPPYQRNDYIGWITRAKQVATRQKRLNIMLNELAKGQGYMNMPYTPKNERK